MQTALFRVVRISFAGSKSWGASVGASKGGGVAQFGGCLHRSVGDRLWAPPALCFLVQLRRCVIRGIGAGTAGSTAPADQLDQRDDFADEGEISDRGGAVGEERAGGGVDGLAGDELVTVGPVSAAAGFSP